MPLAERLARFFSGAHEAQLRINEELKNDPTLTEAQLFMLISNGHGTPSTHASGHQHSLELKQGKKRRKRLLRPKY